MPEKKQLFNRRNFLKHTGILALIGGYGMLGTSPAACANSRSKKRERLAEPSPMIPPVPAILLTINGDERARDEISVVWTFVINSNPAQIGISVHDAHVALGLVDQHGQFVLNVPTADMAESFDRVDMSSKKVLDKFAMTGFTRGKAVAVNAPTIAESPIHIECSVFDKIVVPPARMIYLANVAATTVHENICDESGRLDVSAVPFFGMTVGSGEFYTMGTLVGHIGQSVGKDDIKY